MIAFTQPKNLDGNWFGALEFPIDSYTFEEAEDPEMAEAILEHVRDVAEVVQRLRLDGWRLSLEWGENQASYLVTHPGYQSAAEANQRLEELRIKRVRCLDI